jgi:glutamate carboxypeptidase
MLATTSAHGHALETAAGQPMLAQVERWCAVPSGSDDVDGLAAIAALLADAFAALRGAVRLIDAQPVERVAADGVVLPVPTGASLHLQVRPQAPVQLLLTGHMDTVYGLGSDFRALTWRDGNTLNGPGVADMKGGIAIILAALLGVEASPLSASLGYEVVITGDEETGSLGSAALIAEAARGKAAALTYEPSALPDGTLAGARPGSGNFAIVIEGRSAHAGRNPEVGRNAIVAAADLALRLAAGAGPWLSVNPARIDGGGPNNVVPDKAVLRVNLRPATPEDQVRAQALLDEAVTMIAAQHDVRIYAHGGFARPPKPLDLAAERLFGLVRDCGRDLGLEIGWQATGGVCDGNNIAACGVPVVDTMGARGGAIHSRDEYLLVDSLAERAMLSTLVMLRLAEHGAP